MNKKLLRKGASIAVKWKITQYALIAARKALLYSTSFSVIVVVLFDKYCDNGSFTKAKR